MIRYSLFEFAALPGTGASWMIRACQHAGFGPAFVSHAYIPFSESPIPAKNLRVSLIRHPLDWIAHCYLSKKRGLFPSEYIGGFAYLSLDGFDGFVKDYLKQIPGEVGLLYNNYKADSYTRIEDMPHAFYELMESLGVPRSLYNQNVRPIPNPVLPRWNPDLRRQVAKLEMGILEEYDYIA